MERISLIDYLTFLLQYRRGMFGSTLIGKAFLNHFYPQIEDRNLAEESDFLKATDLIFKNYVSDQP